MSRRILHIIDSLGRTGAARQLLLLSQGLVREGWDVHVAALRGAGVRLVNYSHHDFAEAGISVKQLGRRFAVDPLADLLLARHVARLRPDVIQTWDTVPGLFGALALRKRGMPRVIAGQYRINQWTPSWEWFIDRRLAGRVDRFVTNSTTVRDWCISQGLPADRFIVIPSGVPDFPSPSSWGGAESRDELLLELHLPHDARLIGVVGRLVPEKRVKDLIWAADLLRVLHDNLRLLIIGDGPERQQLMRYARMASDLDHIRFLGERADVERILPHLNVLWNGSENTGASIAILEAMAAGVPVVASDTPSNRELITENETGYLIPLGTRAGRAARARATDRIFTDTELAARFGTGARERLCMHFAAELNVQRHGGLYYELLP